MAQIEETPSPLKVPFGLSARGELQPACLAQKAGIYHCPECGGELLLREGPQRRAHFAHKVEGACNGETWLHRVAKAWLAQAFVQKDRRRRIPGLMLRCCGIQIPECPDYSEPCGRLVLQDLRFLNIDEARLELSLSSGYRPDVVLLRAGVPVLSLEVQVSHAVDEAKAKALGLELPWVEVAALDLLQHPMRLKPLGARLPWRPRCPECASADLESLGAGLDRDRFRRFIVQHRLLARLRRSLAGATLPWLIWHCPRCRRKNKRRCPIEGASSVSSAEEGSIRVISPPRDLIILIRSPQDPYRPTSIRPIPRGKDARIILAPGLREHPTPLLIATNLSGTFVCARCHYDAISG